MSITKNIYFTFVLLFTITFSYSQIVTSKKEALKKGIYQKPSTNADSKKEVAIVTEKPKKDKKKTVK